MLTVGEMARHVGDEVFGPGRAHCLRAVPVEGAAGTTYRLDFDNDGRVSTLYVKLPTQSIERRDLFAGRLRTEYALTSRIHRMFPQTVALRTVAPAAFVKAVHGLATWASRGTVLEGMLRQRCRRWGGSLTPALARCAQAAAWLSAFHRLPCEYDVEDARARLDTYYDDRLVTLAKMSGSGLSDRLAADVKAALMRMLDTELARTRLVCCHNDYSPHNMLVEGPTLCVLDYSFAGPGLPAFDIACFWHKLDDIREAPLADAARVAALQRAFAEAATDSFDLASAPAVLGLSRLVLSKMITRLREPSRRPDVWLLQRRRYRSWLRWLESGFEPRHLGG